MVEHADESLEFMDVDIWINPVFGSSDGPRVIEEFLVVFVVGRLVGVGGTLTLAGLVGVGGTLTPGELARQRCALSSTLDASPTRH